MSANQISVQLFWHRFSAKKKPAEKNLAGSVCICVFLGSSRNLVASNVGFEVEFPAEEEDSGSVVFEDTETASAFCAVFGSN